MLAPRRRRAASLTAGGRPAGAPRRVAVGVLAAGAVVLTATGGTLVGPAKSEALAESARQTTAEQVAQVWRSAGTGTTAQPVPQSAPSADVVALQAELVTERAGAASRSQDRLAAAEPAAPEASAATSAPAEQPAEQPAEASDPVAQAEQRVQELLVQQAADDVDRVRAADAAGASAAQARAAVTAAEEQRAAEAAAAALAAAQADPRAVAAPLVAQHGWGAEQFSCLDKLWTKESGWRWSADNPTSSAYGIPQALPGAKMASHGEGWESDPRVQIAWGLDYIADVYGAPCRAWGHSQSVNWY